MKPPIPEVESRPDVPNPILQASNWLRKRPYVWIVACLLSYLAGVAYSKFQKVQAIILTEPRVTIYRDKDTGQIHIKR